MKQKLLTIALFFITAIAAAQVTAGQVPNIVQCNIEVFNLTVQTPVVLGAQNPAQHTVTYHTSLAAAQSGTPVITDPTFFVVNGMQQTVYIRVTKNSDSTFATTSFLVRWDQSYVDVQDQYVCNSYILPAMQNVIFRTAPNGGGLLLPAGTAITATQTIHAHFDNNMGCTGDNSFTVYVTPFTAGQPTPLITCSVQASTTFNFDLTSKANEVTMGDPAVSLTYHMTQQDAQAGINAIANPSNFLSVPGTTVFIRATKSNCTPQIRTLSLQTLPMQEFPDIMIPCVYTLPPLNSGNYYTGPNGAGTMLPPGSMITTTQVIYVYYPQCMASTSFIVEITNGTSLNFPNVFECESYTLPTVAGVTYTINQLVVPAGTVLTESALVAASTSNGCQQQQTFVVQIAASMQQGMLLTGCDANNNGQATYDFSQLEYLQGATLTLYATEADAIALQNPLPSPFVNTAMLESAFGRITKGNQLCSVVAQVNFQDLTIVTQGPQTVQACDPENDGLAVFNLMPLVETLQQNNPVEISFHETEDGAENNGFQILNVTQYTNVTINQVIYARLSVSNMDCYKVLPVTLQVVAGCTPNSISGIVRFDSDGGGCSASDVPAQNVGIYNIVGNTTYQTFTNADGTYSFNGTPDGSNIVVVNQVQQNYAVTPAAHQVTLPGTVTGKDFCLSVPNPVQDVSVMLFPVTQARPGFSAGYSLIYSNVGTLPASGTVSVYFPTAKVSYVSSSPAMSLSGNLLTLTYTNLQPMQSMNVYITFMVQPPQIVPMGDVLTYAAVITPGSDNDSSNNTSVVSQTVVNSYDPNDISVLEGEFITEQEADGYLHYTIRFQNIGNADAVRVRIENPLDANLDLGTLQPLSSSHNYHLQRKNANLTFTFDDIYLPGSQYDEPGSHGYVTYRIKPRAAVTLGDSMSNKANIYFDFNDPIVTNTVTTTVQAPAGTTDFSAAGFTMYPNPANGFITLGLINETNASVIITDVLGKTVLSSQMTAAEQNIDISSLNTGIYFVKVTANGQHSTKKLVVK